MQVRSPLRVLQIAMLASHIGGRDVDACCGVTRMIRIVLVILALSAAIWLALRLAREVGRADVDWRGVAFAGGFVALAFYLHHATGIGGLG